MSQSLGGSFKDCWNSVDSYEAPFVKSPRKSNSRTRSITRLLAVWISKRVPPSTDWPLLPTVPGVTPVNNLLSVSAKAEHPNFVNPPKGEVKRRTGADPF